MAISSVQSLALVGQKEEKARCVHIHHFLFYTMSFLYIEFFASTALLPNRSSRFPCLSVSAEPKGLMHRLLSYGSGFRKRSLTKKTLAGRCCSLKMWTKF